MKRLAILFLLFPSFCFAQRTASNPLGGNLTVQDAGTCSTTGSFLWQVLPSNASTTTVNLSGTFSGTVTVRESNNGGGSWTTAGTQTTVATASYSTNGFTDICADVTTYTSGTISITISTGLNTGPVGPAGPAASGSGISSVPALPGSCTPPSIVYLNVDAPPNFKGNYGCTSAGVYAALGQGGVDPAFIGTALTAVGGQAQIVQAFSSNTNGPVSPFNFVIGNASPAPPITQGHSLLVLVRWQNNGPTLTSITDGGDTFTQVGTTKTTTSVSGSAFNVAVFLAMGITGGQTLTVAATFSAGASFPGLIVLDLTPSSIDVQAGATGNSTALASGNVTTTNNQDTLFGLGFVNVACTGQGCTAGSGYSFVSGFTGITAQLAESQVVNATGTYSASATAAATADWAMFVVAMKGTAATPVLSNTSGTGPFSLGTITTILTPLQFKVSGGQITAGQTQLSINITSGTITNGAFALTASIDGGTTWIPVPCNVRGPTISGSDQTPIYSGRCDLSGLMGESGTSFRFAPVQGYGIANLVVWGAI